MVIFIYPVKEHVHVICQEFLPKFLKGLFNSQYAARAMRY